MDACSRPGLAEEALYAYPRGGQTVSGPSIRLAEELARCWGNIDYGMKELSRREGETEMEAYCWDLETNVYSAQKFTVKHLRDKRGGPSVLTDERDIYEIGANMGSRRMRARILAVVPGDVVDAAVQRCRDTLAGKTDVPLVDRIRSLTAAFAAIGVSAVLIERRFKKPAAELTNDDLVDLRAIYKALKDGVSKAADWFGDQTGITAQTPTAAVVNAGAAAPPAVDTPLPEVQPDPVTQPETTATSPPQASKDDEFF